MEFVAVAAICLLSAAQSAPVSNCESLLERLPIRGREEVTASQRLILVSQCSQ